MKAHPVMIKRRNILKSTVVFPAFLGTTVASAPQSVLAIEPTTVLTATSVVNGAISMFRSSSGLSAVLKQLNIQLNTMIELQTQTIRLLAQVSAQVEKLSAELDQALINNSIREQYATLLGILTSIERLYARMFSQETTDEFLTEVNEELMESLTERAQAASELALGLIPGSPAAGDRGLGTFQLATNAAYIIHTLVPSFRIFDKELETRGISLLSRTARYEAIVGAQRDICGLISGDWGATQEVHQKNELAKTSSDGVVNNWITRIPFPTAGESFNFVQVFRNFQAYGPCTHGHNFDDFGQAHRVILPTGRGMHLPLIEQWWTNYRFDVQVRVVGTLALVEGQSYGVNDLSVSVVSQARNHHNDWRLNTYPNGWNPRKDSDPNLPVLPIRRGQFECPGMPLHDRPAWSQGHMENIYTPDLLAKMPTFADFLRSQTVRRLSIKGIEEARAWSAEVAGYSEETLNVLQSA